MLNGDETEREGKQIRALLDLWEMLNDPDSRAENRNESLIAGAQRQTDEDAEKLIVRRRKGGTSISDIDGSQD